jgi:hypothetical protein
MTSPTAAPAAQPHSRSKDRARRNGRPMSSGGLGRLAFGPAGEPRWARPALWVILLLATVLYARAVGERTWPGTEPVADIAAEARGAPSCREWRSKTPSGRIHGGRPATAGR